MISERIAKLEKECARRGTAGIRGHFQHDLHTAAKTMFQDLPQWEKVARSMAYAVENMEVYVSETDRIGGRVYYNEEAVADPDPTLDEKNGGLDAFYAAYPEGRELQENQLIGGLAKGHITWFFHRILEKGVSGLIREVEGLLENPRDAQAAEFYQGVLLMLNALLAFNDKHVAVYRAMGMDELADRMEKVPRYPAENFREAVQSFYMQHIVVMSENPYGGNGPGWLDHYLWPYLKRDLEAGSITLAEAREVIDELFLRINERIFKNDIWVEAIVVGGTNPDGSSGVNPLTYMMVESIIDLDITHPSVYVRLPKDPPEDLVTLCARYMMAGRNRAQILYDPAVVGALVERGTPFEDAVGYGCGGCMEVGVQGMTSDYLYIGWQNASKMLELMITGGVCLRTGKKIEGFHATKSLVAYDDFESFYADFVAEARRLTHIYLREQDIGSEVAEKARPSYLLSSMIDDCLARGRNMHAGGAIYHDYGGGHLGMPDVADGLYAINKAVFEEKFCTADELIAALKADYKGYEALQAYLRALPKYGTNHEEVDALAARIMEDFSNMYLEYETRWGGRGKPIILTFVYSPQAAAKLGARPDGRNAGMGIAHGVTPQSGSMTDGITSAIHSCGKMPHRKFAGGASTMWDFDSAWATEEIIAAVIKTFIDKDCQIFQGNTTPLSELLDARVHPEEHKNLIVRVGGYSARFVTLSPELQEEIITRIRHAG